jgi:hypothetical protein
MCTSPTSTSCSAKASPVEHVKLMVKGVVVVASESGCRHTPASSAVEVSVFAPYDAFTVVPGDAKPHTEDGVGARWRTTWSPNTLERVQGAADAAAATADARMSSDDDGPRMAASGGGE